jgi:hypothetical protein
MHMSAHKDLEYPAGQYFPNDEHSEERIVMTPHEIDYSPMLPIVKHHDCSALQMVDNKVHYFHMRNYRYDWVTGLEVPTEKGGTTVAAIMLPGNVIKYAMAKCSENDNFCRKIGRGIAEQRLKSPRFNCNFYVHRQKFDDVFEEFADWVHMEFAGTIEDY